MDTVLTLVIAVGGIATGIGAIWTAVAARHQAQLTERSLTEQNERLRLNLEVDLLHRLEDRYDSQIFIGRRSAVATYYLNNAFEGDDMVGVERLNEDAIDICNFFENVAYFAGDRCVVGQNGVERFQPRPSSALGSLQARHREGPRRGVRANALRGVRTAFAPGGRHGARARRPRPHAGSGAPSPLKMPPCPTRGSTKIGSKEAGLGSVAERMQGGWARTPALRNS